jgi:hypothetical protein
MNKYKTCAVVQGNVRTGTSEVLSCLQEKFDSVIFSTWDDEDPADIPTGNWEVILSNKPKVAGYSHRNFQRLSTAKGLKRARELNATHVLKWRSDMLPTRINPSQLVAWSNYDVPASLKSRLVTCAFRNLTVKQDWFSSIPDLFAFSDIELMEMLWGDSEFDYENQLNAPADMLQEFGLGWKSSPDVAGFYAAESELYAIFKARLQRRLGVELTHSQIAKKYMRLIDHRSLGICWFGNNNNFRPIVQALQHPWWTESTWLNGKPKVNEWGYPETSLIQKFKRKHITKYKQKQELNLQKKWFQKWVIVP